MSDSPSIEQRVEWTRGFGCATDKAVLKVLVRWFAWRPDGTNIRPKSVDALAEKTLAVGISKRSTERALQRLEEDGWISAERRHRQATTYRICVARLAPQDPDGLTLVVDHGSDRQSGGQSGGLTAKVADKNAFDRQSGGQEESGGQEIRPDFEKVADKPSSVLDLYVQESGTTTGYTHTPARASEFRHPNHAYCGVWFCVPTFLEREFLQQTGWTSAQLRPWYQAENAWAMQQGAPIGNALKYLRARFEGYVDSQAPAPQQLTFGPLDPTPPVLTERQRQQQLGKQQFLDNLRRGGQR